MMKRILTCVLATMFAVSLGHAQNVAFEFPAGARNASLVNANIAEASDISGMYENPAPLAFLESGSVMFNHSQGSGLQGMQENLAFPVLARSPIVIALALDALHASSAGSQVVGEERSLEYGYDVVMAGAITSTLSLGGLASLRRETASGNAQTWGAFYSLGADYAPTPDISYGIVYHGTARSMVSPFADSVSGIVMGPAGKRLELGGTMIYPSSASLRSPIVLISFANEKVFGVRGLYYKGGIELRPWDLLAVRFGYLAGPRLYVATYGMGITSTLFALQYAVCPFHNSNILLQQFSLSVRL